MMIIRDTAVEDWEILKDIRLAALRDAPTAFGVSYATAAAYTDSDWRDRASSASPAFVLAFMEGVAIGIAGHAVSKSGELNLIAMWVKPDQRGTDAAAGLVEAIKARAVARGHSRVVLSVSPENVRAAALYRKQGFVFLPEWEPIASQPGIDAQKMAWDLVV